MLLALAAAAAMAIPSPAPPAGVRISPSGVQQPAFGDQPQTLVARGTGDTRSPPLLSAESSTRDLERGFTSAGLFAQHDPVSARPADDIVSLA
jgi:hypothetical protein